MSRIIYDIEDVLAAVARLDGKVNSVLSQETEIMKTLGELVTDLTAKVANITEDGAQLKAAVAAAIALLNGVVAQNAALKAKVDELLAMNPTPEQLAKLQELSDGLTTQDETIDAEVKTLNDATEANTGS